MTYLSSDGGHVAITFSGALGEKATIPSPGYVIPALAKSFFLIRSSIGVDWNLFKTRSKNAV